MQDDKPSTYKMTIEYDGSPFHGWQEQKNARSIVGELRTALTSAGVTPLEIGGSGRTDAGVHALAQVAHLRLSRRANATTLADAVNERLPAGIHVLAIEPAKLSFHARHDALSRTYLYQISRRRTALGKRFAWWVKEPLDLEAMDRAAALIPGRHDYALFCESPAAQASTLVDVESVELAEDGALLLVRITASHFLWKMVRRLVGALVRVGTGELSVDEMAALLAGQPLAKERGGPAAWTAPAAGLYLEAVRYAADESLPELRGTVSVSTPLMRGHEHREEPKPKSVRPERSRVPPLRPPGPRRPPRDKPAERSARPSNPRSDRARPETSRPRGAKPHPGAPGRGGRPPRKGR